MGAVFNRVNNVLTRFLGFVLGFESGGFELGHGHHEITVPVEIEVRNVWTKVVAQGNEGCGQFPVNKAGCLLAPGQIIFIIDIETESAKIEWFAVQ